ncbi:MAG TPA: GNAT family N-acetyltransferase [Egibacteraceae bacterium]|nr:GNAT family N-acetyltransferase [Egibacteraceae bacterium]
MAQLRRTALDGVVVSPMRRRHLPAVLRIERAVYPRPWTEALFAGELEQRASRRYVVALAPRTAAEPAAGAPRARQTRRPRLPLRRAVVGYAGLLVQAEEAHVTTVAVHPAQHRRKIATRLLLTILCEARAMGAQAATLEVRTANRGAQRLYQAFGFAPVGTRPGYYSETGEDALIMWVHDLQGDEVAARLAAQASRLDSPGGASGAEDIDVPWVRGRIGLAAEPPDPEQGAAP